jgi:chaperone BCS1
MIKLSRKLKAVTFDSSSTLRSGTLHDNEDSLSHIDEDDVSNTTGLFNFHKWNSKSPLIYKPNFTSRYFSHNGHLFHWTSDRRASLCNQQSYDQFIVLRCFGRSAKPIKDLLHEIKGFTLTKEFKTTEVYRSSVKAEVGQWLRQSVRPSRPVRTVSLDEQQKERIISDINEYLQPNIARWYAMRGIPHRRGYLFHGPPGTGKTSLSFALAGVFGLSIYCVSLSETGLTESHLAALFRNLPDRCIVLLEDIDAAGLRREGDLLDPSFTAIETGLSHRKSRSRSLISLAGLLNIIDGAASQEVRLPTFTVFTAKSDESLGSCTNNDHKPSQVPRPCSHSTGRSYRPPNQVYTCDT